MAPHASAAYKRSFSWEGVNLEKGRYCRCYPSTVTGISDPDFMKYVESLLGFIVQPSARGSPSSTKTQQCRELGSPRGP
jgi:hypothetical protein